jgi:hypothetical protein
VDLCHSEASTAVAQKGVQGPSSHSSFFNMSTYIQIGDNLIRKEGITSVIEKNYKGVTTLYVRYSGDDHAVFEGYTQEGISKLVFELTTYLDIVKTIDPPPKLAPVTTGTVEVDEEKTSAPKTTSEGRFFCVNCHTVEKKLTCHTCGAFCACRKCGATCDCRGRL